MTEDCGDSDSRDIPKIVANVMVEAPPIVLKLGFGYLMMKRRVRKSARAMETAMKASGLPEHLAHRLSVKYEEDSRFVEMILKAVMNKETLMSWRSTADSKTGN
jgi:hypothetical protein